MTQKVLYQLSLALLPSTPSLPTVGAEGNLGGAGITSPRLCALLHILQAPLLPSPQ